VLFRSDTPGAVPFAGVLPIGPVTTPFRLIDEMLLLVTGPDVALVFQRP
jgi:hypothetical protein